jgi:chaperonin GroEL
MIASTVRLWHGFDARSGDYGYLFAKGVVDAGKMTRSALPHAASIGAMARTPEVLIADLPEKNRSAVATGAGYGGDMDF